MDQEIIIGIVIAVIVLIALKVWVFRIVKFKIDESTTVKFLKESSRESGAFSSEEIAAATGISQKRVTSVCLKSGQIQAGSDGEGSWNLV